MTAEPIIKEQPKDADWEREWDGVTHFKTWRMHETPPPPGTDVVANCGEIEPGFDGIIDPGNVVYENECPLCAAIHNEICRRL